MRPPSSLRSLPPEGARAPFGRPGGRASPARWLAAAAALIGAAAALAQTQATGPAPAGLAKATFAGGCFWCVEADFDKVPGVKSTTSGYIGGKVANPTYEQVAHKGTGHAEAVEIVFDPKAVSYEQLVEYFWRTIDPTTKDRQFCDFGSPYRTGIFVHDAQQLAAAKASLAALNQTKPFSAPIATEITLAGTFYAAEDYHQDYYRKNPLRYQGYRSGCGRDARLRELWGGPPVPPGTGGAPPIK